MSGQQRHVERRIAKQADEEKNHPGWRSERSGRASSRNIVRNNRAAPILFFPSQLAQPRPCRPMRLRNPDVRHVPYPPSTDHVHSFLQVEYLKFAPSTIRAVRAGHDQRWPDITPAMGSKSPKNWSSMKDPVITITWSVLNKSTHGGAPEKGLENSAGIETGEMWRRPRADL